MEGMKWLQSVFANNFNRFRKQNGHVFQGRYKAILLDGSAVGPVCHYIHLNPVRAGIVQCGDLQTYRQSSFHRLWKPSTRWLSEDFSMCLQSAGNLVDKPAGRHSYRDYLGWLSEEEEEMKKLGFEKMLKGWAKGSEGFKQSIMGQLNPDKVGKIVEAEASGLKTAKYEKLIPGLLSLLGKEECDISKDRKGDGWKVATARYLRDRHLAPNGWIAERLGMGKASSVQSLISRHRKIPDGKDLHWEKIKNHGILD